MRLFNCPPNRGIVPEPQLVLAVRLPHGFLHVLHILGAIYIAQRICKRCGRQESEKKSSGGQDKDLV